MTFTLTGVDGHGIDANVFTVITANYTDAGNGPAAPVTGSAEAILQPKLKQAEYFATTGRTADGRGTGDPGVVDGGHHRRRRRHRPRPSSRTATGSRSTRTTSRT